MRLALRVILRGLERFLRAEVASYYRRPLRPLRRRRAIIGDHDGDGGVCVP